MTGGAKLKDCNKFLNRKSERQKFIPLFLQYGFSWHKKDMEEENYSSIDEELLKQPEKDSLDDIEEEIACNKFINRKSEGQKCIPLFLQYGFSRHKKDMEEENYWIIDEELLEHPEKDSLDEEVAFERKRHLEEIGNVKVGWE